MVDSGSVPRNFKLLDELEASEKAKVNGSISYGLEDAGDMNLSEWNANILGPAGGVHEGRIYFLHVSTGASYPSQPPVVRFVSKINLPCVN
jgi:ubiquitin-conjugating enzyme E2 variant